MTERDENDRQALVDDISMFHGELPHTPPTGDVAVCDRHGVFIPRYFGDGDCPTCLDVMDADRRNRREHFNPYKPQP